MILCACFYIDKTEWFEEQFLYSQTELNRILRMINTSLQQNHNILTVPGDRKER